MRILFLLLFLPLAAFAQHNGPYPGGNGTGGGGGVSSVIITSTDNSIQVGSNGPATYTLQVSNVTSAHLPISVTNTSWVTTTNPTASYSVTNSATSASIPDLYGAILTNIFPVLIRTNSTFVYVHDTVYNAGASRSFVQGNIALVTSVGAGAGMYIAYTNNGIPMPHKEVTAPAGIGGTFTFDFCINLSTNSNFSFVVETGTAYCTNAENGSY